MKESDAVCDRGHGAGKEAAENFGFVVCFYLTHWVNCFPDTSAYKPGRDSDLRVLPSRVAGKII